MSIVLEVFIPVFGLALFGYIAARLGWFSHESAESLANFVQNFAVPLLLFRTLAQSDAFFRAGALIDAGVQGLPTGKLLLGYYAPMAMFYGCGWLLARWVFGRAHDLSAQIITGFACSYGNALLLGLPIALLTFGATDAGVVPFFILIAMHALGAFTLTTIALEYARGASATYNPANHFGKWLNIAKQVARNPIILGAAAGIACNRLGLTIPMPLDTLAQFMQNAVTPCALFSFGAILNGYRIAGRISQTIIITALKCLAFPCVVWFSCRVVLGISPLWSVVATLLAAQPVGVSVFMFATRYNTARVLATTAVFLSTLFTLISIPVLLYLIDLHGLR